MQECPQEKWHRCVTYDWNNSLAKEEKGGVDLSKKDAKMAMESDGSDAWTLSRKIFRKKGKGQRMGGDSEEKRSGAIKYIVSKEKNKNN